MLKTCLVFWKAEPEYAYKRYAYKKTYIILLNLWYGIAEFAMIRHKSITNFDQSCRSQDTAIQLSSLINNLVLSSDLQ